MAEYEKDSIGGLVRSVLEDTRELIREEIALARAEIREEMSKAKASGASFGAAALAGLPLVFLRDVGLDQPDADRRPHPHERSIRDAGGAPDADRNQRDRRRRKCHGTAATVKENLEWIQSKSGQK